MIISCLYRTKSCYNCSHTMTLSTWKTTQRRWKYCCHFAMHEEQSSENCSYWPYVKAQWHGSKVCILEQLSHRPSYTSASQAILLLQGEKPSQWVVFELYGRRWRNVEGLYNNLNIFKYCDCPHKPTRVFTVCFVLTRTIFKKLFRRSPIPKLLKIKHAKLLSFYGMGPAT